jgi:hypothetical protein
MTTTCWNCKTEYTGNICPECDCHQSVRDAILEDKEEV